MAKVLGYCPQCKEIVLNPPKDGMVSNQYRICRDGRKGFGQ